MVRAWLMPENDLVASQFDRNYIEDYSLDSLRNIIGVEQYQVSDTVNTFHSLQNR